MRKELDYESAVHIDPTALDVEWLRQADLMMQYSDHAAQMRKAMDLAKESFDLAQAQIDTEIRGDPDKYLHGVKLTEGAVKSIVTLQPRYKEASAAFLEARYEYDVALGAVRAIDQKKSALENLVRLLGVSYFAAPKAPHDLAAVAIERPKMRRANAKIRISDPVGEPGMGVVTPEDFSSMVDEEPANESDV